MSEKLITPELIAEHGLTEAEHGRIVELLGREPNHLELGIFSVMWSEHCSYKSSKAHLKKLPTDGPHVLQGPGENAGVVDIGDGLALVFKIESHNHPSFIEPFQGAATGVGGILRDIFTMGARPLASLNSLRFGPLDIPKNRYLMERVVAGIASYGNCIGVPTIGGEIQFSEVYNGNPLVNVFNMGLARHDRIFLGRADGVGNAVMYVGSKTGRDGIHGATMASEDFDETSEERRPTVQVGDPFTEKLLLEACLEVMKEGLLVGIQDMGAAGLTCSTSEMASRGGSGISVDLALVPRREEGMTPYEIMLSESQERMLLVSKPGAEGRIREVFAKWNLDCVTVGEVTEDGLLRVTENGRELAAIPARALTDEAPVYDRPLAPPEDLAHRQTLNFEELPVPEDCSSLLLELLASPSIASKEWVWRQYDHMVRINTVVLPGSDAAVIRIPGTTKGVAMSLDGNGRWCWLDPRQGGKRAVAEAARNVVCSGARPLAITNCLNFGNPERGPTMWAFAEVVEGMAEACRVLGTPVTGGNVSFYNETLGAAVYPTPVVGVVGLLEDISHHMTQWFKDEGDVVVLLGPASEEVAGSEYLAVAHGLVRGRPSIDLEMERSLQELILSANGEGLLKSAHDVSDGGLAVALAESGFRPSGHPLGCSVSLEVKTRPDAALFGEAPSRVVVSCAPESGRRLQVLAEEQGVPFAVLGTVEGESLVVVDSSGRSLISVEVSEAKQRWQNGVAGFFERPIKSN
ncbi:MAG: phosphoribosylformylglycinamidine synthase subunit PurL [Nitrospinae bacterium]|nr:phosphoribosylformylglycinamidine synthase subunit PurL [Nitrospinota bacterium]